jgi:hypothetical protein
MKAYVLETIQMAKIKRPTKNLPAHCFVSVEGKERQLGAPILQHAAEQVPAILAFKSLQNKLGEKSELF